MVHALGQQQVNKMKTGSVFLGLHRPALVLGPFLSLTNVPAELQRFDLFDDTSGAMTKSLNFHVEADDEDVTVTLDGTAHMVRYCKVQTGLKLYHSRGDDSAPIHDIHFLARAWQLANTKAKELGWVA